MRFFIGFGITLFVVCLLADLGYMLGTLNFSGEPVGVVRHEGGDAPAVGEFTLDPGMNPLRTGLKVNYSQTLGSARLYADVALQGPTGQQVWTRRLRVSDTDEGGIGGSTTKTMPVERFEVTEAGVYRLTVTLDDSFGGTIHSAEVDLRRNVRLINWWLAGGIGVIGMLGMGLALALNFIQENFLPDKPRR